MIYSFPSFLSIGAVPLYHNQELKENLEIIKYIIFVTYDPKFIGLLNPANMVSQSLAKPLDSQTSNAVEHVSSTFSTLQILHQTLKHICYFQRKPRWCDVETFATFETWNRSRVAPNGSSDLRHGSYGIETCNTGT